MKKIQTIYEDYNLEVELNHKNPLYKGWNSEWLKYLGNLNGLDQNQKLKEINLNLIEHYTEEGAERYDFDPNSKKIIQEGTNNKKINLFEEKYKHIFLEFINLKLNINSISGFIYKYGSLGSPVVQKKYNEEGEEGYKNINVIKSELVQCWFVEIKNLQSLFKNYQYFTNKNYKKLNEKFTLYKNRTAINWEFTETEFIEEKFPLDISFSKNTNYTIKRNEKKIEINNENNSQIFGEYIVEIIKRFYSNRIRAHVDSTKNWFNTSFEPKGLIGFIWHLAIKLIEEKNKIKNCNYCNKEFIIGRGESRKNKVFCKRSHAVLSKRENDFSNKISKLFLKNAFEIKLQEKDSMFDFMITKNNKKISGVNISMSESLDNKSKKWNFMLQNKIFKPMKLENIESAYLINKNLNFFLFNKHNGNFKKLKSPLGHNQLMKFIKKNEK